VAPVSNLYAPELTPDGAVYALQYAKRKRSDQMSYGYRRAEVLGGLMNGCFLLSVTVFIVLEAIQRYINPPSTSRCGFLLSDTRSHSAAAITNPLLIIIVAGVGLAFNIVGMFMFHGAAECCVYTAVATGAQMCSCVVVRRAAGHGHHDHGHDHAHGKHNHGDYAHEHEHDHEEHEHAPAVAAAGPAAAIAATTTTATAATTTTAAAAGAAASPTAAAASLAGAIPGSPRRYGTASPPQQAAVASGAESGGESEAADVRLDVDDIVAHAWAPQDAQPTPAASDELVVETAGEEGAAEGVPEAGATAAAASASAAAAADTAAVGGQRARGAPLRKKRKVRVYRSSRTCARRRATRAHSRR